MHDHQQLIARFYTAFANHDAKVMSDCYHSEIEFNDPVFGTLIGSEVSAMWAMLIERSGGDLKIEFSHVETNKNSGSADWVATYNFSKTNRKVINKIHAEFEFENGLIRKHTDTFDMWKWSKQAFGFKGFFLGWTNFMRQKIRQQAAIGLKKYNKQ
jgi:hypothetical protein